MASGSRGNAHRHGFGERYDTVEGGHLARHRDAAGLRVEGIRERDDFPNAGRAEDAGAQHGGVFRGVAFAEAAMGEAIGRDYVQLYFKPDAKAKMDALVANVKAVERPQEPAPTMTTSDSA